MSCNIIKSGDIQSGVIVTKRIKGFTLIELLVVIAIIALLLSILVPALSKIKQKGSTAVCLTNTKHMSLGWYMYQEENDGRLMSSYAGVKPGRPETWIRGPHDAFGNQIAGDEALSPAVTDEDEIRGFKMGKLWSYVETGEVYHCPGDKRKSVYDGTRIYLSYVAAACLNGHQSGRNSQNQLFKFSEITSPSRRYVFVECGKTCNFNGAGIFLIKPRQHDPLGRVNLRTPMSINHGDSGVLGFVDGHSEVRIWRDRFTLQHANKPDGAGIPPDDQQDDADYMNNGWAYQGPWHPE